MERILSVKQMKDMDNFTMQNLGISSETLIERASIAVADEIIKRFPGGRVLVCIGKGNNGEDGKIIAKILSKRHGFSVITLNVDNGIFKVFDKKYDIIVDAIFGIGLNRDVEGKYKTAIDFINNSGAFVVSCDIPSGLDGNTGLVRGAAVKANLTVAIQEYKIGHFLNDGPDYTGNIVCKDIGISIWGEDYINRFSDKDVVPIFQKRKRNVNKGNFGKVCIFGGSICFPGSVLLSYNGLSALRVGVGYSNLAVPKSISQNYSLFVPECTLTPIDDKDGFFVFNKENIEKLFKYDSIVFGMGVGVSEEIYKILSYLIKEYSGNLIIDADGLNALAKYGVEILLEKKCNIILLPHLKEFSRLSKIDINDIFENIVSLAKDFAFKYNIVLVVKSATTIITNGDKVFLNTTGSSGMAKGGSGDVLAGMIGALLLSLTGLDILTSISATLASLANVGPGLGDIVGPEGTYTSLSDFAKIICSTTMLLGRLELTSIIVLFLPFLWRKNT